MAHYTAHSRSSAAKFGGIPEDYHEIHRWMDETKAITPNPLHRMLRHHTNAIWEAEKIFGESIPITTERDHTLVGLENPVRKRVPVTYILERHLQEDLGWLPSYADWVNEVTECMREGRPLGPRFQSRGSPEPGVSDETNQRLTHKIDIQLDPELDVAPRSEQKDAKP